MLGVGEGDDRRAVDSGQANERIADVSSGRGDGRTRLQVGESRGHLGSLAELVGEAGASRLEVRDIALDADVAADVAVQIADGRDGRLHLVEHVVGTAVDEPPGPALATGEPPPQRPVEGRGLLAALEDPRVPADHCLASIAGDALEGRVGVLDRARAVGDDHGVGRLLDGGGESIALCLGRHPLGHVAEERDVAGHAIHDHRRRLDVGQQRGPIPAPTRNGSGNAELAPRLCREQGEDRRQVRWRVDVGNAQAEQLVAGVAEERARRRIDPTQALGLPIRDEDRLNRALEDRRVAQFGGEQRLLCAVRSP